MSLKIGDKAPDFTLFNQDGEKVSLSNFSGKQVVVLFFPFSNTGGCTKELCTFRDELKVYENLNAQVLAISVDSHFGLKLFGEKNNYTFPLLSDFNKEVIKAYGIESENFVPGKIDYYGVAKRSAFIVDTTGKLKYVEVLASPGEEINYLNIKKALEA